VPTFTKAKNRGGGHFAYRLDIYLHRIKIHPSCNGIGGIVVARFVQAFRFEGENFGEVVWLVPNELGVRLAQQSPEVLDYIYELVSGAETMLAILLKQGLDNGLKVDDVFGIILNHLNAAAEEVTTICERP